MNLNRSVFWHQGLLLQPQHFQQTEQYFQSVMLPYRKFIQPHFWGIGRIEIQKSSLGNRSFRITGGEFHFPGRHLCCSSRKRFDRNSIFPRGLA